MKKLLCCFALLTSLLIHSNAQVGEWTWMKGTASPFGGTGTWGTKGVPDVNNNPPSVYEASEWYDHQNHLWVFGGVNNSSNIYYATLWMYDIATNEWTWVSGTDLTDQGGVYGTQGVPSSDNYPGARGWGALSWRDSSGAFWLFGGYGYDSNGDLGVLGDLWKYDIGTNEWTWMRGSSTINSYGNFGVQGTPDINNDPPARQETSCAWKDSSNHLWMFGGWSTGGQSNDLWQYDIPTNTWTWMKGSNSYNHYGTYGTMGVADPANTPGSRAAYAHWVDKENNLWLYGGNGYSANGNGFMSDLWKYDMSANEWTWIMGSNVVFELGIYGTKCDYTATHYPSNKYETRACWTDDCGYFFLYGGTSYDGHEGDLWVYNSVSNQWAWLNGDTTTNTSAVSGTQGVSSPLNKPGLRTGSCSWRDELGNFWLFGGYVCSDDLWRYVPDYACIGNVLCPAAPQTNFSVSDTQLCQKFCTNFFDQSNNNPIAWQWIFEGASPASSTDQNPTNICYDDPGTYDVTLITTNANGNDTLLLNNFITVNPTPPIPTITQSGYTLTSSAADFYQWQLNTVDIPGATNQSYDVLQTGFYTVIVSDTNSCKNSTTLYVQITGIDEVNDGSISVYPNPSNGNFIIELMNAPSSDEISLTVVNTIGQKFYSSLEKISSSSWKKEIDLSAAAAGVYFIEIKSNNFFARKKITISK